MFKRIILFVSIILLTLYILLSTLYRIPVSKMGSAPEKPIIRQQSEYTVIDLLEELDAQGYDTKPIREEFFSTTTITGTNTITY